MNLKMGVTFSGPYLIFLHSFVLVFKNIRFQSFFLSETGIESRPNERSQIVGEDGSLNSFCFLQDTFSMAVSFLSGKVVYISPQGSSLLRCKPERLQGTMFSDLLAPQDVSTFYSSTAPCRLPPWASCIGSGEHTLTESESRFSYVSLCFLCWLTPVSSSVSSSWLHPGEVHVLSAQCWPAAGRRDALLPISPHALPAHHQRLGCCWATALLPADRREGPLWIWRYLIRSPVVWNKQVFVYIWVKMTPSSIWHWESHKLKRCNIAF